MSNESGKYLCRPKELYEAKNGPNFYPTTAYDVTFYIPDEAGRLYATVTGSGKKLTLELRRFLEKFILM